MQSDNIPKRPVIINGVDTTVGKLPIIMTVGETARALRLSEAATYKAIAKGEIPSTKLAGRIYVISGKLLAHFDDAEAKRLARLAESLNTDAAVPRNDDAAEPLNYDESQRQIAGRWVFCTPPPS